MRVMLMFTDHNKCVVEANMVFTAKNEDEKPCVIVCTNNGTFMVDNEQAAEKWTISNAADTLTNGYIDLSEYGEVHSTRLRRAELEE